MIVITGANGGLGEAVVERLLERMPASEVGVSVRDPQKAEALAARGVRVRRGDFADPASLEDAFAGASQVLVVSPDKLGEEGRRLSRAAIGAARAAGARRVLYTSHMGTYPGSPFRDHYEIEATLAEDGRPFTSLRHGFYAESLMQLVGQGIADGEIRAPEDGPVSWTARADLAAADAALLADEGRFDGLTPPLTAATALALDEVAALASEVTGREVRRTVVPDDEWRDGMVAHGAPAPMAEMLLGVYRDARRGVFAAVDPTLETLLGRPPQTVREFLAARL